MIDSMKALEEKINILYEDEVISVTSAEVNLLINTLKPFLDDYEKKTFVHYRELTLQAEIMAEEGKDRCDIDSEILIITLRNIKNELHP